MNIEQSNFPFAEELCGPSPDPDIALWTIHRFAQALGLSFSSIEEVAAFARDYFEHIMRVEAASQPTLH